jgi:hypothetical protein
LQARGHDGQLQARGHDGQLQARGRNGQLQARGRNGQLRGVIGGRGNGATGAVAARRAR